MWSGRNLVKTRVLVTGGAGFLGSNLCKALLNSEYEVICLDSFTTGATTNIDEFAQHPNFTLIEHDVRMPFDVDCDVIVNLACPASPPRYQINPVGTLMTNVLGTFHGLELARKRNAKFIQASTSEIYGDPLVHPQKEDYWGNVNPIGPRSCYDEGKRAAETLCYDFRSKHQVKTTIVRIFNTYGINMARNDGRVVSNLIVQAIDGKKLTMFGSGNQTRCFCYVSDLVRAFMSIIDSKEDISGPINLGNDREITMIELGTIIQNILGVNQEFEFLELPSNDPSRRKPDLTLAHKYLDWHPEVSLEEGLALTIDYFQNN
jgi:UDP-glucuronate decarboxylase